jgi:hypothetical protein
MCQDDGDEESEEDDIDLLSASLAQRRVRRVVFNSEMAKLVARVEQMGITSFLKEVSQVCRLQRTILTKISWRLAGVWTRLTLFCTRL